MNETAAKPDFTNLMPFEQIWAILQETSMRQQETDRILQETSVRQQEIDRILQEICVRQQETDRQMKDTDRQMKDTDRQMKDTDRQMKDTDRKFAAMSDKMGCLDHRFGEMVEHLVAPGIAARFNELQFHFDQSGENIQITDHVTREVLAEFDSVLENEQSIVVSEIKAKPNESHIIRFTKKLQMYREHLHRIHKNEHKKIYGAVAGAIFPVEVRKIALEAGLYVIIQTGDTVKIIVPEDFQPKEF